MLPILSFGSTEVTPQDRKSTRLNSSHLVISYAVFCLKKKKNIIKATRHVNDRDSEKGHGNIYSMQVTDPQRGAITEGVGCTAVRHVDSLCYSRQDLRS